MLNSVGRVYSDYKGVNAMYMPDKRLVMIDLDSITNNEMVDNFSGKGGKPKNPVGTDTYGHPWVRGLSDKPDNYKKTY